MLRRTLLSWLLLIVSMASCTPAATATPVAVILPGATSMLLTGIPAAVSATAESSATPELLLPTLDTILTPETEPATQTFEPYPTLRAPFVTLAATDFPQPKVDAGAIQIFSPGPMSKVVSTITIYGYAIPGYSNRGRLDLYGEDGRLIATELIQLNTAIKWAYFNIGLLFNVTGAGELGRLTLSTQDQYGRLTAVYSVHLLLMLDGLTISNPPGNLKERCVLGQPATGKRISGGVLSVAGGIRPFNSLPFVVELIGRDGALLGSQLVSVSPAVDDRYVPFRVDLPYTVNTGTWARLTVRQSDDRIPGTMYLFSQEVLLNP